MKKKTKTFNRQGNGRVREEPGVYGCAAKETLNFERRTSNIEQREQKSGSSTKQYDLDDRLLEYAIRIIRLVDALPPSKAGRHVADQLLRCGTSPLANHGELQAAESRRDFIHKLGVCLKEIREAQRWLRLIHRVPLISAPKIEPLLAETEALIKIFRASIRTAGKQTQ
jgi:four helix bundle protein